MTALFLGLWEALEEVCGKRFHAFVADGFLKRDLKKLSPNCYSVASVKVAA
jgi:hypothetical protein